MRICFLTDLHWGIKNNSELFSDSQLKFFTYQLVPYLKQENIKDIYIFGDVFDNRNTINTRIHNLVYDLFHDTLADFNITILIGNHDTYFNNTIEINSLKFLSQFNNIQIVDKITERTVNGLNELWVPWITNEDEFLKNIVYKKADVCFGHFDLKDFQFDKSRKSDKGLDAVTFSNVAKQVFTGHYHTKSTRKIGNSQISYIGTPYQLTRIDSGEPRGFTVYDTDSRESTFVENNISIKFIKLDYPNDFTKEDVKNNIIDLHINYDSDINEKDLDSYVKLIESYTPATTINMVIETKEFFNNHVDLDKINLKSIPESLKIYLDSIKDLENKDDIYNILLELYNETKNN